MTRQLARNGDAFDTTSLTSSRYGYRVHRDYAAHFFRWGWVARQLNQTMNVLEVGCGVDYPLVKVLEANPGNLPRSYAGTDLNRLVSPPNRRWNQFYGEFNFLERHEELGVFDRVVCLEVIEHMLEENGAHLLRAIRDHLRDADSRLYLSTPVFNGKAAKNHVHEYTIAELSALIEGAGLRVIERYGTFASQRDLASVISPAEAELLDRLRVFYSNDVLACFLAPLYPDASRNNFWVIARD